MQKFRIRNHAFDRIGDTYGPVIDHEHFLGHSAFDSHWKKTEPGAVNLSKQGELFTMEIAVAGFSRKELTVAISDDVLVIRGVKKHREDHPETEFLVEEFATESFERKFRVNPNISKEKITANYQDGILRLTFIDVPPEEEKSTRFIQVG
jgi:HSP20 family protein